ncbi:MAG: NAD+ synthase [Gammaproteobacteria bacterium]|nr:NAD+ synthase [Gammaproteobacteria bacterium]MCI0590633.1 NAD+ synthase [Gammaproteobacteria bacterium]
MTTNHSALRIVLAQLNLCVGDIQGNTERIIAAALEARDTYHADVVAFPELAITSYPPEDLLLRPGLHRAVRKALLRLVNEIQNISMIVGYPLYHENRIYNACSLIQDSQTIATYHKQLLPNYSVFDEKRYFAPGEQACVVELKGIPTALTICEDIWEPGPTQLACEAGAQLMININASPYHIGKAAEREQLLKRRAKEGNMPIIYLNLVGGQDELVFDGGSMVVSHDAATTFRAPEFEEGLHMVEFERNQTIRPKRGAYHAPLEKEENIYNALVLGVRDYINKNQFAGAVLGLSGGIDSSLTLRIAVDAIGKERVEALIMPSRYTADMSVEDARTQANAMGISYQIISIEPPFTAFTESLRNVFSGVPIDATEENIQARCRGVLLMALSNKKGKMVLTTGNKSEIAVGYATLYGDMAGGFAPLKDVSKTLVYQLARWRNRIDGVIPQRVFDRAPTAELAPDQKDEDSLPPYSVLDPVLERYVELDQTPDEIIQAGFDPRTVRTIVSMVNRNEYKRRQAAPGVRITKRAFGRDRRYPITSMYNET